MFDARYKQLETSSKPTNIKQLVVQGNICSNQRSDPEKNSNNTNNEEISTPTAEQTRVAKITEPVTARVRNLPEPHK